MPLVYKREVGKPYYRWQDSDLDALLESMDGQPLHWIGNVAALRAWLTFQEKSVGQHIALRCFGQNIERDKYGNPTRRTRYWSLAPGRTSRQSYNDWCREHEVIGDILETVEYAPVPPPPPPPPFKVGDRIWRPAFLRRNGAERKVMLDEPRFEEKGGSWMFRACRNDDVAPADREMDPGIMARWMRAKDEPRCLWTASLSRFGLVCFSREPVPKNWTYFEVTGLGKDNKTAFVRPVEGNKDELLAQYRMD